MTDSGAADRLSEEIEHLQLAAVVTDGVVVLEPLGTIAWTNDAFARMVGYDPQDLIGRNGLEMVHPEDLARAMDGMRYAFQFAGRTSVAPYRIRRSDDSWLAIEFKSGVLERPEGQCLVSVIRDGTARRAVNQALETVANGRPIEFTAQSIAEAVLGRWPHAGVAITLASLDGVRAVRAGNLTGVLLSHAEGLLDRPPPWDLFSEGGDVVVVELSEMSDEMQAAAVAAGFECYTAARVADPTGAQGCVVVWFDSALLARFEFVHAAGEFTELLGLALERRHHLRQLWHMARHDPLTGVLNRAGFDERFTATLGFHLNESEAVGVLYIDLDGLKGVNDRDGHAAGDRLLLSVARRLEKVVGTDGLLGRFGGDEFVIAVRVPRAKAQARCEALATEVLVVAKASVGIAIGDSDSTAAHLIERADSAMYRAKSAGRSCWSH